MVVSWIVALTLIVFIQFATRNMKPVPDGAQNLLEWLVEGLNKFIEGSIGPHLTKRTFWFFATIFIFILSANWVGLIPRVGTMLESTPSSLDYDDDLPSSRSYREQKVSAPRAVPTLRYPNTARNGGGREVTRLPTAPLCQRNLLTM